MPPDFIQGRALKDTKLPSFGTPPCQPLITKPSQQGYPPPPTMFPFSYLPLPQN